MKHFLLPTPRFIIFYNGSDMEEDRRVLKLSDSFIKLKETGCIEVEALMVNINYGRNQKLMENCKTLMEYAILVDKVKRYSQTMQFEESVDKAVLECIEEEVLKDILTKNRSEVVDMLLTEYDEEKTMQAFQYEIDMERAEKERERARADKAERELRRLQEYIKKNNIHQS